MAAGEEVAAGVKGWAMKIQTRYGETDVRGGSSTKRLEPNCPVCKGWVEEAKPLVQVFRMSDGTVHAAPGIWMLSRAMRHEKGGLDGAFEAMCDWAEGCELQARYDAQHKARVT